MDHMVTDYTGPRYFIIGTNHESVKRHALRKMNGKNNNNNNNNTAPADNYPPPQDDSNNEEPMEEDEVGYPINTSCVQYGHDELDELDEPDRVWTNEELHEAAALPF
ncbi:hypothetical protein PG994_005348 [Apiospora phragmitis]|uniref:Uncharacterized protein n=1 Tax=Apiospora phragmitis TaxID=2905665 RepID=A0ABR1VC00_9PEZI